MPYAIEPGETDMLLPLPEPGQAIHPYTVTPGELVRLRYESPDGAVAFELELGISSAHRLEVPAAETMLGQPSATRRTQHIRHQPEQHRCLQGKREDPDHRRGCVRGC